MLKIIRLSHWGRHNWTLSWGPHPVAWIAIFVGDIWHLHGGIAWTPCRHPVSPGTTCWGAIVWQDWGWFPVAPWLYQGFTMALPWLYQGFTMALPGLYHIFRLPKNGFEIRPGSTWDGAAKPPKIHRDGRWRRLTWDIQDSPDDFVRCCGKRIQKALENPHV